MAILEKYFPSGLFAGKRVHLGVTGSIAAYKALDLLRAFHKSNLLVSVGLTASAARFVTPLSFRSLGADRVYSGLFPQGAGQDLDEDFDPFGHLTPGAEADAFVIAPVSATTLARLASGLADEILSAQALAYPGPLLLAPGMNPRMWANPATRENCRILRERGHIILEPDDGLVACAESGKGKLTDPRLIYLETLRRLSPQDFAGKRLVMTMGPTREQWDSVRFWSNHSTGLMGAALAVAAWLRGASVCAVTGPGCPWLPPGIQRLEAGSAMQMFEAVGEVWSGADYGIFTAAVADFYPKPHGREKFKKADSADGFQIEFYPNPDILFTVGQRKKEHQRIVGFAAESSNLEENARAKLGRKNADLLVGNRIGGPDSGFAAATNEVFLVDKSGREEHWPLMPKAEVAWRILDWLSRL
ncbi:bifunctional phosphopantothenoylcysteine decarboxylase/phosphopantothenate--cysteine ligase CoaBC [Desulfovibrio sp. OttesenSCG-928-C14]|nr:bifunctional phosphopantothenoylcysteine decarboxylase/phosphopantothenate--cysteine ligase CoaBC [Desulfovibrio sp. OttesenSCG-928-C14]